MDTPAMLFNGVNWITGCKLCEVTKAGAPRLKLHAFRGAIGQEHCPIGVGATHRETANARTFLKPQVIDNKLLEFLNTTIVRTNLRSFPLFVEYGQMKNTASVRPDQPTRAIESLIH
jgi:hypothetical protein